ncbi:MAG: DUF4157 domain-containing protein [Verrucomicrobiales bacterium]|nr:DUF4157 domain-containing protein [Verrucomicrobiales bacterium]
MRSRLQLGATRSRHSQPAQPWLLQRKSRGDSSARWGARAGTVPASVSEVVRAPGQPLDSATRELAESRFGHDFAQVRVHTDRQAGASARQVNARAYTVGHDVVFGEGQFVPGRNESRALLAHELAHVIQQSQHEPARGGEKEAQWAEEKLARNQSIGLRHLGSAERGIQRQEGGEEEQPAAEEVETPPVRLTWPEAYDIGGTPTFGSGPILLPPPPFFPGGPITPPDVDLEPSETIPPTEEGEEGAASEAPSRLSVFSSGSFSLGLRLGFPDLELTRPEGAPPSALSESLARAQLINQTLTGEVPSSWEALDKAKLAGWAWGVFSTYISPETARSITESLSGSTGEGGVSYQLDAVLFTDFSGGGLSLQLMF